ncbi:spore germination protein GerW family protein [Hymenobacter crusticola]|uniref:spore germination protein GerW family protein n=1 Tax=Hymenobacter crusticola TaxID=1770526 RepID=UPI000A3A269F|nr:spore germination protein GerW family protein [Hymenobacter crusticola]
MNTSPDPQPLLNHFLDQFVHAAGTRAVFGEPVVLPYATVVPVAKVIWGLGAGFGGGGRAQASGEASTTGSGGGYGGGAKAYPVGVIDIRPERTRFLSTPSATRQVLLGVALGIALTQLLKLSSK